MRPLVSVSARTFGAWLRQAALRNLCSHSLAELMCESVGRPELRLVVVSPFLDRHHGTEGCLVEQIECLAFQHKWEVHLYSQRVDQVRGVRLLTDPQTNGCAILWHKVSDIRGPHLLKYLWWFLANNIQRWWDRRVGKVKPDLIYSPGINCLDADVIVVHVVFHEFFSRVSSQLRLRTVPLKSWHLVIHRWFYYRLAMLLEHKVYRDRRVRLIAVSNLVARHLRTYFDRSDVVVIPNAVDTRRFAPSERLARRYQARQRFQYSEEDFLLLLIGNDLKNKGLDSLLQAIEFLDIPVHLLVVGSDDPHLYEQQMTNTVLRQRVRFESPSPDVLQFYAAADAYVGPSLGDAFGLPIIEAMACGLPVVASIHAGASEFIRNNETGLLLSDPRDPHEIAGLVLRLYRDNSLRQKMGRDASQYIRENCSWETNASKTRDFLQTLAETRIRK